MKFDLNINQKAIVEHGFEIDVVDASILDFCLTFAASGACTTFDEKGVRYFWFQHENICAQLPILRMKPDTMYRRMKGLCEKAFLQAHPENRKRNQSYYALCANALLIEPIGRKSDAPSDKNPMPENEQVGTGVPSDENPKGTDENPMVPEIPAEPSDENPKGIGLESEGPSDENPMYKNNKGLVNNLKDTSSSAANAGEAVDKGSENLDAEVTPPNPQVPAAPLPSKKIYGDGVLQKQVREYARSNPDQYAVDMYTEFLSHWTEIVQNSERPGDIGKELWRTKTIFTLAKKLENWYPGYQRDKQNRQSNESSRNNSSRNGAGAANRTSGAKAGSSRPVKKTATIKPGMFGGLGQSRRDSSDESGRTTIRIDVD